MNMVNAKSSAQDATYILAAMSCLCVLFVTQTKTLLRKRNWLCWIKNIFAMRA